MGEKRGADLLINSSSIYLYHLSLAPHYPSDVSCILFFFLSLQAEKQRIAAFVSLARVSSSSSQPKVAHHIKSSAVQ